jgi:hypothetical protein
LLNILFRDKSPKIVGLLVIEEDYGASATWSTRTGTTTRMKKAKVILHSCSFLLKSTVQMEERAAAGAGQTSKNEEN